jgi:hypothetical protein
MALNKEAFLRINKGGSVENQQDLQLKLNKARQGENGNHSHQRQAR